jgi:hypothetical protein
MTSAHGTLGVALRPRNVEVRHVPASVRRIPSAAKKPLPNRASRRVHLDALRADGEDEPRRLPCLAFIGAKRQSRKKVEVGLGAMAQGQQKCEMPTT